MRLDALLALLAVLPGTALQGDERPPAELVIDRGGGQELSIPRDEKLVFRVRVEVAFVGAAVGQVTMRSSVEPYRASMLGSPAPSASAIGASAGELAPEIGVLSARAVGSYAWYSMDSQIETRILPQDWPQLSYRYTHEGSERRRREVLVGVREDGWCSSYRRDTEKNAPQGTRIWKDAKTRAVPPQTIDLLSAVYLARNLVRAEAQDMRFPLIDKESLWDMRIARGRERRVETPAGTFDAFEIQLDPKPYAGEEMDEEKVERFEGLFGLRGTIHLWVERSTGVPVRVQGNLPVGPLDLEIDVSLESYTGTPPAFAPRRAAQDSADPAPPR